MLSLTGVRPTSIAASIPASTSARQSFPVMALYRSGRRVSRLTLTRASPASLSAAAFAASSVPFVVMDDSTPGGTERMISRISRRSRGSPPVNLMFFIPNVTPARISSAISSALICSFGFTSPSAWQ